MPTCKKCQSHFPNSMKIDGKKHSLQRRKFCLTCSPWKSHNTRDITKPAARYVAAFPRACFICKQVKNRNEFYKTFSSYCKPCFNKITVERMQKNKKLAVEYKGGECEKCGYDKCIYALEFHHIDPSKKDTQAMFNRSFKKMKPELDKCVLLCANCHREEHERLFKEKKQPDLELNQELPFRKRM